MHYRTHCPAAAYPAGRALERVQRTLEIHDDVRDLLRWAALTAPRGGARERALSGPRSSLGGA